VFIVVRNGGLKTILDWRRFSDMDVYPKYQGLADTKDVPLQM
jgi:hypothetical protein